MMYVVSTKNHVWVKHTITPVSALQDEEGQPVIFVDPDDVPIAEDNAVYGCDRCGNPMYGYMGTECEGDDDET